MYRFDGAIVCWSPFGLVLTIHCNSLQRQVIALMLAQPSPIRLQIRVGELITLRSTAIMNTSTWVREIGSVNSTGDVYFITGTVTLSGVGGFCYFSKWGYGGSTSDQKIWHNSPIPRRCNRGRRRADGTFVPEFSLWDKAGEGSLTLLVDLLFDVGQDCHLRFLLSKARTFLLKVCSLILSFIASVQ